MVNNHTQGSTGESSGGTAGDNTGTGGEEETPTNPLAGQRVTENTPYTSGDKTATIPAGFTVSGVTSEQTIDGGLVIYLIPEGTTIDWTNPTAVANAQKEYDQFVWIPVDDINEMYMCQSEDGTKSCKITVEDEAAKCTTHNSPNMAGRLYATELGENFNVGLSNQTYVADSGHREPAVTVFDGLSDLGNLNGILEKNYGTANDLLADLQSEYNEIVKSVYENKGFYVGRYETSNITDADGTEVKVVAGTTDRISNVTWYYMYAQQRDYAVNKELTVGSTMIQGAAYDQIMKFVNTDTYNVKATGYVSHDLSAAYQTGGLDYVGAITYNDISKNIYDLEGNVMTWTTESDSTVSRVYRGGYYYNRASASCRSNGYPNLNDLIIGTMIQLYVK